ncbi:uncharacterized protein LOC112577044 [Pomacea canaliculata]|uniref:uncharacterized protein LOC112577044 n=1 Tax=Pomacea canaliculata TaxID=400727 RepID=UPI000D739DF2|nr:uncharacterized protein LOC112577044 [Pomacea canaliculata]
MDKICYFIPCSTEIGSPTCTKLSNKIPPIVYNHLFHESLFHSLATFTDIALQYIWITEGGRMAVLIITLIIATMFGVNADEYRPTSEAVRSVKVDDPDGTNTKHSNSNPPISNTERVLRPLDSESRDLLQKFDDFLFSNLENLYYRFSNAFQDATKRALKKCGCDVGAPIASRSTQ